jgi:hypothetical protein
VNGNSENFEGMRERKELQENERRCGRYRRTSGKYTVKKNNCKGN